LDEVTQESFADRAKALAEEGARHSAELETRRQGLIAEREEEVKRVRETFAVRIYEVEAELATVRKLQRALEPEQPREARRVRPKAGEEPRRAWTPRLQVLDAIVLAMAGGIEHAKRIAERTGYSESTMKYGLDHLRDEGLVRLAGVERDRHKARIWKLTPAGQKRAEQLREAVSNGKPSA
jgi:hypothetical protein